MNARSSKDKEMASHLKKMGVRRTTGNCPMCHSLTGLGGGPLMIHLGQCRGRPKVWRRGGSPVNVPAQRSVEASPVPRPWSEVRTTIASSPGSG